GVPHLGYAARAGLAPFGSDVYGGSGPAIVGPGCAEAALPRPRRGVYRRGGLIASARTVRSRDRAHLQLVFRHRAALDVRQTRRVRGSRRTTRLALRSVRACRTYLRTLSRGHGSIRLTARAGGGRETRTLRF